MSEAEAKSEVVAATTDGEEAAKGAETITELTEEQQYDSMRNDDITIENDNLRDMLAKDKDKGVYKVASLFASILELRNPRFMINMFQKLGLATGDPEIDCFTENQKTQILRSFVRDTCGIHLLAQNIAAGLKEGEQNKEVSYAALFSVAPFEHNRQGLLGLVQHPGVLKATIKMLSDEVGTKYHMAAARCLGTSFIDCLNLQQMKLVIKSDVLKHIVGDLKSEKPGAILFSATKLLLHMTCTQLKDDYAPMLAKHEVPELVTDQLVLLRDSTQFATVLITAMNFALTMMAVAMFGSVDETIKVLGGDKFKEAVTNLSKHPNGEVNGLAKIILKSDDHGKLQNVTTKMDSLVICQCSNPDCQKPGTLASTFFVCGACKLERYCCKKCQKTHWKRFHKAKCAERVYKKDPNKPMFSMTNESAEEDKEVSAGIASDKLE